MPKVFITGSNSTRGYLTGSGYITNPTRVLIREKDNKNGSYPTKLRFGTHDRSGNLGIRFNDQNTLRYGDSIHDDFNFKNNTSITAIAPNNSLWSYTSETEIRREEKETSIDYKDGVLVFSGTPDGSGRWIQTRQKVRNPTVVFELLQGPYQEDDKLNLSQGKITDILKVQISPNGSSWTDIEIDASNVSNSRFLNGNTYFTPTFDNSLLKLNIDGKIKKRKEKRLSCFVKLDMKSFKMSGQDFYIRIIQTAVSDNNRSVWGIEYIKIISRNDSLEYPLLANQGQKSFSLSVTGAIDTPNTYSSLFATGSSIANLTDSHVSFQAFEENISFFNDNKQVNDNGEIFYDEGVDPDIYPGFNSKLSSKDAIEIKLNTINKIDVGFTRPTSDGGNDEDETGQGDVLMTYWNKDKSSWEKIGKPRQYGLNNRHISQQTHSNLQSQLTSSCIGFNSSLNAITNGTSLGDLSFVSKDALVVVNKPTDVFNFPYGPQYYATSSLYLKARDLGITKPFVVEKAEIIFDIELEIPQAYTNYYRKFLESYLSSTTANPSRRLAVDGLYNITPTFFMLRQFKDNYDFEGSYLHGYPTSKKYKYNFNIPSLYDLSPSSSSLYHVDKNRELIGFASTTFSFIFSDYTANLTHDDWSKNYPTDNFIKINESGKSYGASPTSFTGSNINTKFTITNFSNYSAVNFMNGQISGNPTPLYVDKKSTNRTNKMSIQRGIVNNITALDLGEDFKIPGVNAGNALISRQLNKERTANKVSPYIIFPEDEIIFGWQYPSNPFSFANERSVDDPGAFKMAMGNSKLKLYGSQIQNNKEYHEGLNQHLTSDAIHETIGNDAVLDQFQIATRGEMTGSFYAQSPVITENDSASLVFEVVGGIPLDPKRFNLPANKRIGGIVYDSIGAGAGGAAYSPLERGHLFKNVFYNTSYDLNRNFQDVYFIEPELAISPLTVFNSWIEVPYGLLPSYSYATLIDSESIVTRPSSRDYLGVYPQYSFSASHFGFLSDMLQQGRDGKFIDDLTTTEDDIVVSSPVSVIFVKGKYVDEDLSFRRFDFVDVSTIDGTSALEFQSANLSLNATSDSAFSDDGVIKNRTYGVETLTVS